MDTGQQQYRGLLQASYREPMATDEAQDATGPEQATPVQAASASAADIIVVTTPEGLQNASTSGAKNIEVRSHLDLRSLQRIPYTALVEYFGGASINPLQALFNAEQGMNSLRVRALAPTTGQSMTPVSFLVALAPSESPP